MSAIPQTVKPSPQVGPLDDIVLRRPQPISSLSATDPELNLVYEYWTSCRKDGLLPRRKDIDVLQLKPVLGHTHLVDVSAQDPADYRFRLYGSKVRLDRFRNYSNTRVGDYRLVRHAALPARRRPLAVDPLQLQPPVAAAGRGRSQGQHAGGVHPRPRLPRLLGLSGTAPNTPISPRRAG
jgi:hypothetical protein